VQSNCGTADIAFFGNRDEIPELAQVSHEAVAECLPWSRLRGNLHRGLARDPGLRSVRRYLFRIGRVPIGIGRPNDRRRDLQIFAQRPPQRPRLQPRRQPKSPWPSIRSAIPRIWATGIGGSRIASVPRSVRAALGAAHRGLQETRPPTRGLRLKTGHNNYREDSR
jgi:hypothetical protein